MSQMKHPILSGTKEISKFVGCSWSTILRWIDEKQFPGRKLDGIWESGAELIIQWRQRQIGERAKLGGKLGLA
jgi:predicted DNA-binding transcriptional regulator AlpA